MENFFYNESYLYDIDDLLQLFDIEVDGIKNLPENWEIKVELAQLEPVFKVDLDTIAELLLDSNEDRLAENMNREEEALKKALIESVNFDKLNSMLPKLFYPNNTFKVINKEYLVDFYGIK